MPQVPYNPVPSVQPSGQGTPELRVNTPSDAFGVGVGQAIQGLGGTIEKVGDEVFARGLALQKLQNETLAKQADTDYMIKAGEMHAKFSALEGQEAVDAYPEYAKGLQTAREQIRAGLNSDETKRMYDSQSLSTMGRSIFNGAGHSATEQKKWSAGVVDSNIRAQQDGVYASPKDDVSVARTEKAIEAGVRTKGDLHGWSDEQTDQEVKREISTTRAMQVQGLARTDPVKALEMFDKYKDTMTAKDAYNTEQVVQRQSYTTGARIIAGNINKDLYDPDKAPDAKERPLSDRVAEGRDLARQQRPDDPLYEDYVTKAIESNYNNYKQIKNQDNEAARQTVEGALLGLNNPQGKVPSTMDELRADPAAATAFDRMKPMQQRAVLKTLAQNSKGDVTETPERRERYHELLGMSQTAPAEFLDQNMSAEDIPAKWKTELYKDQLKIQKGQAGDPRVAAAMQQLEGSLRGAGITPQTKDEYNKYKGALMGSMQAFRDEYKKPPSADDIQRMGARLLQDKATRWWQFSDKNYAVSIPDDVANEIKKDAYWQGAQPTDEQVRSFYMREQFKKLYKSAKESGPMAPQSK